MKKYYIILILIAVVNILPFIGVNTDKRSKWIYDPSYQENFKVEVNEEELSGDHQIWITGQFEKLAEAPSKTIQLLILFYIVVVIQFLIHKRKQKQANQRLQRDGDTAAPEAGKGVSP